MTATFSPDTRPSRARPAAVARTKRDGASTLRVALDATHQRQPDGGISRYARQLATSLRKTADVEIIEIGGGRREERGTVRRRLVTLGVDFIWHPWIGKTRAAAIEADVYHSPGLRGPLNRGKIPVVVTVHDLVAFRFPELFSARTLWYTRTTLRRTCEIADIVICNSEDTANDVVRLFGFASSRVRVTPLGVDPMFFERPTALPLVAEPYVLFVGSEQPRKNLERLEHAVEQLRARGFPHILVTAGADRWGAVKIGDRFVRRLYNVSDEDLVRLYAGAACLAIPSLHEGFGLPALEAMAAGTPVVAADVAALPEVTGGAAVMVDPLDTGSIADGLERAIGERDSLVQRGRQRAAQFTWERTAAMTLDVYRELV